MKITTTSAIFMLVLALAMPPAAAAKKKKQPDRGMIESMEAVACGAKQRGITGLGSVFGSVGIEHVSSDEKLCPQYLIRTDEMEYQIRPLDKKHPVVLPVGHEGELKIKKDKMQLKVPDGDRKTREYQVVAAKPLHSEGKVEASGDDKSGDDKDDKKDDKPNKAQHKLADRAPD
jgi:hypothetical protein